MRFFHAAILVPNLEEAILTYGPLLDVDFLPPVERHYPRIEFKDKDCPFDLRISYSTKGPFYIELLQVANPELWGDGGGHERFHHFGMWADDPVDEARKLEATGFEWEANIYDQGYVQVVFIRRGDLRVEILNAARRAGFLAWTEGHAKSPS